MMDSFTWGQLSILAAVIAAVWSLSIWINGKFNKSAEDRGILQDKIQSWLSIHEGQDQKRHVENIERFAKIETKLDIVIKNGR